MNLLQAPTKGRIYALYTDRVVYEQYEKEKLHPCNFSSYEKLRFSLCFVAASVRQICKTRHSEPENFCSCLDLESAQKF